MLSEKYKKADAINFLFGCPLSHGEVRTVASCATARRARTLRCLKYCIKLPGIFFLPQPGYPDQFYAPDYADPNDPFAHRA